MRAVFLTLCTVVIFALPTAPVQAKPEIIATLDYGWELLRDDVENKKCVLRSPGIRQPQETTGRMYVQLYAHSPRQPVFIFQNLGWPDDLQFYRIFFQIARMKASADGELEIESVLWSDDSHNENFTAQRDERVPDPVIFASWEGLPKDPDAKVSFHDLFTDDAYRTEERTFLVLTAYTFLEIEDLFVMPLAGIPNFTHLSVCLE